MATGALRPLRLRYWDGVELLVSLAAIIGLLVLFGLGPVLAFLDVLSRELITESGINGSRLLKGLFFLLVPLSWIVYFVAFRRRRPFGDDFE